MSKPRFYLIPAEGFQNCHFLYRGKTVIGELVDINTLERNKILRTLNTRRSAIAALELAESFMRGFEDDETQDGIKEKLATVRDAIKSLKGGL